MTLDSEVDGSRQAHVRYPKPICLTCQNHSNETISFIYNRINTTSRSTFQLYKPCSTLNVNALDPRPLIKRPSGKGRSCPLSNIAFRSLWFCLNQSPASTV
ncbi:hypothetical protein HanXRQr2_Chr03g0108801 [Helianthus annuus]|uniref:Uncharacterized protein n=1 Tax=Helianthus annuus TaxID=4232 RepID=A0A9K3NWN8_HELAN|nr:hypothetical protein HanXRQr2_Chr03g0108801 [Helianthus annuus]KAJ0943486.1 hypothetical protein HanPSC8_Chr03g0105311 [Helianthus annuus]